MTSPTNYATISGNHQDYHNERSRRRNRPAVQTPIPCPPPYATIRVFLLSATILYTAVASSANLDIEQPILTPNQSHLLSQITNNSTRWLQLTHKCDKQISTYELGNITAVKFLSTLTDCLAEASTNKTESLLILRSLAENQMTNGILHAVFANYANASYNYVTQSARKKSTLPTTTSLNYRNAEAAMTAVLQLRSLALLPITQAASNIQNYATEWKAVHDALAGELSKELIRATDTGVGGNPESRRRASQPTQTRLDQTRKQIARFNYVATTPCESWDKALRLLSILKNLPSSGMTKTEIFLILGPPIQNTSTADFWNYNTYSIMFQDDIALSVTQYRDQ